MARKLKCAYCRRLFTDDEIRLDEKGHMNGVTWCTHVGVDMPFHIDCHKIHVVQTH